MAGHQAAAGTLKATLGSRSTRLTEQDYVNLIQQGFDSPEALLDARDKSLEAILVRRGAVDAVLAWQVESKPKQRLGPQPSPPVLSVQDVEALIDRKTKRPKSSQSPALAMMTTGSREVKYNHIASAAIKGGSLSHDPMLLPGFSSLSGPVPEAVRNLEKHSDENHILIPALHQALAEQMGVEVAEVETCPTFVLGSNAVVDSHTVDTIEGLKPDIVVFSKRFKRTALSVVTFIEVVRGDMDLTHIGKVIVYLSRLMEAQPNRTHVYGALTNLEYTTLYHCTGSKTGHTQPVKYEEGGFALLISLLKSADSTLGYTVPELNLPMLNICPVRLLGTGHNSVVYEALLEQSQLATKHAVKVFNLTKIGAVEAFIHERNVLKALRTSSETPGIHVLPKLVVFSSKCDSATAASIVTEAVVSQVSRDSLHEEVIQGYLQGLHCLHSLGYVHGDIEPRHLCVTLEMCPAIIDLGEARTLGVRTDSPKKSWSYRGTVRYATNDILSALAESGQVRIQREARHDLVAFVKSCWAIQWERAEPLNRVHASDIEKIRDFWLGQAADTGMGRKLQSALQFAEESKYDRVFEELRTMCTP